MPLSAGEKLGPYEVLAPLCAGGMGEVRETRLDRLVAIKRLKAPRKGRFEREARRSRRLTTTRIPARFLIMAVIFADIFFVYVTRCRIWLCSSFVLVSRCRSSGSAF
jgi:hypothetical protein